MPDEVRMLDNQYALLFVRGERPVRDLKYDILKHPNIKLTTDGGAEPYRHGEDVHSIVSIRFDKELLKQAAEKDPLPAFFVRDYAFSARLSMTRLALPSERGRLLGSSRRTRA